MTRALILKELRQHWLPLLLIAGISGVGFLLILAVVLLDDSGSRFEALRRFLMALLPLGVLVLCNRLVVREYQSKTQLFIESLPVSRGRMIVVKYLLGLAFVLCSVGLVFAVCTLLSLRSESLTGRFLAIMASRALAFSWCLYSFFFMMGLMGRYRVAIYIVAYLGLYAVDALTQVELGRFGPFQLVDGQFAYERVVFPEQALLASLAIGSVLVLLTLSLALVREGNVATLLAEKMSHREKITVAAVILAFMVSVSVYDERVEKEPFDLPGGVAASCGEVTVTVTSEDEEDEDRELELAQLVADEVAAMQGYLGLADPPPIFITQWGDLDADKFERAELENAEGLLVRANFRSKDWEDGRFLGWLLREVLILWSEERLLREPNLWLLDGFSVYWTCRDACSVPRDRKQLELRAAYGCRQGFSSQDTTEWLRYRDRVGEDIAGAVAWRGLESLKTRQGEERFRTFLRAAMDCSVPADVRGMLHEWAHPAASLLREHAGLAYADFLGQWSRDLDELAESRRGELDSIPQISGEVTIESLSSYTRVVHFRFESEPAPESGRFTLQYAELPAFAVTVEPSEIQREDALYPDQSEGELPGTFSRGARLYSTFATWVDALGCEIVSGWTRLEMH